MDYTQKEKVMEVLTELSQEMEGYNYSLKSGYSHNSEVIIQRKQSINIRIEKLKSLLTI